MPILSPDDERDYAVAAYMRLLECTLATYDGVISRKSSPKFEIHRQESIITSAFHLMETLMADSNKGRRYRFHPSFENCSLVEELLGKLKGRADVEEILREYFDAKRGFKDD